MASMPPTPAHTSTWGTQILTRVEFGPLKLTHSSTSGVLASWGDSSDEVRGTSENLRQATGHRACCLGLAWPERPHPSLRVQGCRECGRGSASNSQNGILGHLACGGSPRFGAKPVSLCLLYLNTTLALSHQALSCRKPTYPSPSKLMLTMTPWRYRPQPLRVHFSRSYPFFQAQLESSLFPALPPPCIPPFSGFQSH